MSPVPTFILLAMALADEKDCICCNGAVEGEWYELCQACAQSIANQTRGVGHPHAPSPAQQAIIDQDGLIGGGVVPS